VNSTCDQKRKTPPGALRIDPACSSVEFHVPHFWGVTTVKGHLERYDGTLDLSARPAIELRIDADSLNTKRKMRDKHLRSADFFDVENHGQVRFTSALAELDGERLKVHGELHAGGDRRWCRRLARKEHPAGDRRDAPAGRRRARSPRQRVRRPAPARHDLEPTRDDPDPQQADRSRTAHPASRSGDHRPAGWVRR
jgi:hypothetical protein